MVAFVAIGSRGSLGQVSDKQLLNTCARPGGLAQECQTGLDRWMMAEAADGYAPTQFGPSVACNQGRDNSFQGDSVQRIAGVRGGMWKVH